MAQTKMRFVPGRPLMTVEQVLAILGETSGRLAAVTVDVTAAQLRAAPEPGEWSAVEVLAHLRSCADVWGEAIETITANDDPTVKAVSPTTWIEGTDYRALEFGPSLQAFTRQRARLLALLESLPADDWSRNATVIGGGKPIERTVHTFANRLARHERTHWKQLEKTIKAIVR